MSGAPDTLGVRWSTKYTIYINGLYKVSFYSSGGGRTPPLRSSRRRRGDREAEGLRPDSSTGRAPPSPAAYRRPPLPVSLATPSPPPLAVCSSSAPLRPEHRLVVSLPAFVGAERQEDPEAWLAGRLPRYFPPACRRTCTIVRLAMTMVIS